MPDTYDPRRSLAEMNFDDLEDEIIKANSTDSGPKPGEPVLDAGSRETQEQKQDKAYAQCQEVLKQQNDLESEIRDSFKWLVPVSRDDLQVVKIKRGEFVRMETELLRLLAETGEDDQTIKDSKTEGEEHLAEIDKLISDAEKRLAGAGAGDTSSPADTRTPQERLDEARKQLAEAEKKITDTQKFKSIITHVRPSSKQKIKDEFAQAQAEYQERLKEATLLDRQVLIAEFTKIEDARLAAYTGDKKGRLARTWESWKQFQRKSVDEVLMARGTDVSKWRGGKILKKMAEKTSVRWAVAGGLLGVSLGSTLAVPGYVAGAGLAIARGTIGGLTATGGSFEAITGIRGWLEKKKEGKVKDEEISKMNLVDVQSELGRISGRAMLDGKKAYNEDYQKKLTERMKQLIQSETAGKGDDELRGYIDGFLSGPNGGLSKVFLKGVMDERQKRQITAVASFAIGGTLAMVGMSRAVERFQRWKDAGFGEPAKQFASRIGNAVSEYFGSTIGELGNRAGRIAATATEASETSSSNVKIGNAFSTPKTPLEKFSIGQKPSSEFGGFKKPDFGGTRDLGVSKPSVPLEYPKPTHGVDFSPGAKPSQTPLEKLSFDKKPDTGFPAGKKFNLGGVGAGQEAVPTGTDKITEIDLRAGAKLEISSDASEAIVRAGGRGLEGSFLDMARGDEKAQKLFNKSMEWLGEKYPELKDNPGALIDRLVRDYADQQDLTVGGGGAKDLDRILSGALKINSTTGEITLGDVKFMPAVEHAADLAQEIPPPSGAGVVEQAQPSTPKMEDFIKYKPDDALQRPDAVTRALEDMDYGDADEASQSIAQHRQELLEKSDALQYAHDQAAASLFNKGEKTSYVLLHLLGKGYKAFTEGLGLDARSINKLKDMNFGEFYKQMQSGDLKWDKYQKVLKTMMEVRGKFGFTGDFDKIPVKRILVEMAKDVRK